MPSKCLRRCKCEWEDGRKNTLRSFSVSFESTFVDKWALFILQTFRHFTYVTTHLQPFRRFTYITAHSPTLLLLHLRHSSFSNPSLALPTSQLILQHFCCFPYVTAHSPTLPSLYLRHNSSPTLPLLHLRHRSFFNPSFASPTSQDFHLSHLASRPWLVMY